MHDPKWEETRWNHLCSHHQDFLVCVKCGEGDVELYHLTDNPETVAYVCIKCAMALEEKGMVYVLNNEKHKYEEREWQEGDT